MRRTLTTCALLATITLSTASGAAQAGPHSGLPVDPMTHIDTPERADTVGITIPQPGPGSGSADQIPYALFILLATGSAVLFPAEPGHCGVLCG
ncbi:hypothetical protein [Nocardia sp. NPDC005366]|uniref:hypothetical protein n=1 Tax=Nocardia sp. NPDC005366 TaxID=3156878 RepID=UPI0033AA229A